MVCPAIDAIHEDTFQYSFQQYAPVGGFDWNLKFSWHQVPSREVNTEQLNTYFGIFSSK